MDMTVGFDAVPLRSGHSIRGIGRYVSDVLDALLAEQREWSREHLKLLVTGDERPGPIPVWQTRRSSFRPQDLDWLMSAVFDRWAIRSTPPSVWHMTDPSSPFAPVSRTRTIATVYDLIPLKDPEVMARIRPHRRVAYYRYLRSLKEARLVVAISKTTAEDVVVHLRIPRDRIRIVYPSILPKMADFDSPLDRPGSVSLLFVGVPDPHKRPELAIRVLAELRRRGVVADLTFAGHHSQMDRAALARKAAELNVNDRVRFLGRVTDKELAALYRTTITLAISSLEGFGLPPVEALLAGGRVVATPSPIYLEVLSSAALYAAGHDPSSIADAILTTPPTAATVLQSGVRDLAERYAPRNAAEALVEIYETVLGQ